MRKDSKYVLFLLHKIAKDLGFVKEGWNGFNVLQKHSGRVGALDIDFTCSGGIDFALENAKLVYLLGADECIEKIPKDAFVVYQGHHGDKGAQRADVILPGAAYTEKDAIYVNTEGRAQKAYRAVFAPGQAKEDWQIINQLAFALGIDLKIKSVFCIRSLLESFGSQFKEIGNLITNKWNNQDLKSEEQMLDEPFVLTKTNFYATDVITRSSATMAKCSKEFYVKCDS